MTFGFFSLFEGGDCEIDTEFHATPDEANAEAKSRVRIWLDYCCHDEDDEPCASSGALIRTAYFDTSSDSEAPVPHAVDPIPQIREAFPEIARRLDALDEVERKLSELAACGYASSSIASEFLTIIREAKR